MNTIFSSSVREISVFSREQSTSENLNVFITRDENIYGIYGKKVVFFFFFFFCFFFFFFFLFFFFILLFSCYSASDGLADVDKQNGNIMTSTLSVLYKVGE